MGKRLWPLELSAIMTFAVLAIITLSSGIAWKERAQLIAEKEELNQEIQLFRYLNAQLESVNGDNPSI